MPFTDTPPDQPIILKCVRGCCASEMTPRAAFDLDFIGRPACIEALAEDHNATSAGKARIERNNSYQKR